MAQFCSFLAMLFSRVVDDIVIVIIAVDSAERFGIFLHPLFLKYSSAHQGMKFNLMASMWKFK